MNQKNNSGLADLEAMTENLPDLTPLVASFQNGLVEYKTVQGVVYAVNLKNTGDVAVADAVMSKGSIVSKHQHGEVEIFILYKGKAVCKIDGEAIEMTTGDTVIIDPGALHEWEVLEDSRLITVTVPAAGGFPNG